MNRKYILYGGLAVGLMFALIALTLVYPFSLSESHPAGDASQVFSTPNASDYSATGAIYTNDELFIEFTGHVTATGAQYYRIDTEDSTVEHYWSRDRADVVYSRHRLTKNDDGNETVGRIEADDDVEIVGKEILHDENQYVLKTIENTSSDAEPVRQSIESVSSLVVTNLLRLQYSERDSTNDGPFVVYEPRDGWYDGAPPYRITGSQGSVTIANDSYEVTEADVEYTYTRNTPSYLDYLTNRDEKATLRLAFTFTEERADISKPAWVVEIRDTT